MLSAKGKEKALPQYEPEPRDYEDGSSGSTSDSDDSSSSDDSSESEFDDTSPEYLESLLEKARQNIAAKRKLAFNSEGEQEVISLTGDDASESAPLPPLNPGKLPTPYIELDKGSVIVHDPDIEEAERASSSRSVPSKPARPPELSKDGKVLTKKERKELQKKAKEPGYFDLPAHAPEELPRLYREVEALRLRNQLDPKRFYRKEEGEGKGIKGLPKQFAIGTILPTDTPFGTQTHDNLPKSARKRTIVDELVDDAESKSYAKKKFRKLQTVRGARGRNTMHKKREMRKAKW